MNALGARLGWLPSFPSFDRSTHEIVADAEAEGIAPAEYVVRELQAGRLRFACEDPDAPQNHPKVMTVWRANLLGSSGKGHEYFLKHLIGTTESAARAEESPPELRPKDVVWHEHAPEGKLDLMTTIDFRMTSNALFSDVVLPAATWYEKYDLSSTDLHPFVHAFNEAIPPPWEAKSDWEAFHRIAKAFSRLAETPPRHPQRSRRGAVAARHPGRDRAATGRGPRLEGRRVRARPRPHDAEADRRRARLPACRRAVGGARPAARDARQPGQGRLMEAAGRDRGARREERQGARRRRGRATLAGARGVRVRGDPRAVGHDERAAGGRGVPVAGGAHGRAAERSRVGAGRAIGSSSRTRRPSRGW